MKKEYSESEIKNKAEAYCSSVERCVSEVAGKLEQWGASEEVKDRVIESLLADRFIDEQRYCIAFVRDKYRFNQWGRMKIVQALRIKKIASEYIDQGLEAIDEEAYLTLLSALIERKKKGVVGRTAYERNGKLIRFAISRGFEMEAVLKCVKQVACDEDSLE